MDWKEITLEQYLDAYNQHKPNWWTRIAFKYFSKETEKKNMKPRQWLVGFFLVLFAVGWFGTAFNWSRALVGSVTITYSIVLAILVLSLFVAVFMNNARLKKIMKILGVDKWEYNKLVDRLF